MTNINWIKIDHLNLPKVEVLALNREYGSMLTGKLQRAGKGDNVNVVCVSTYDSSIIIYATHYIETVILKNQIPILP